MWAIAQYDDRVLDAKTRRLVNKNRAYCRKHGYDYVYEKKKYDLPSWWRKVSMVKRLLESGKYEGVLWLDTDAAVHDENRRLEDLVVEGKSFYYAGEPPKGPFVFNAGVWMVLNDTKGREIIHDWMACYSPKNWKHAEGRWESSNSWAGPTYEQGAFIKYILPKFKKYLRKFPYQVLQSHCPTSETFIVHFMGEFKDTHLPKYNRSTRKNRMRCKD
jgi:hypothetical protein